MTRRLTQTGDLRSLEKKKQKTKRLDGKKIRKPEYTKTPRSENQKIRKLEVLIKDQKIR